MAGGGRAAAAATVAWNKVVPSRVECGETEEDSGALTTEPPRPPSLL